MFYVCRHRKNILASEEKGRHNGLSGGHCRLGKGSEETDV